MEQDGLLQGSLLWDSLLQEDTAGLSAVSILLLVYLEQYRTLCSTQQSCLLQTLCQGEGYSPQKRKQYPTLSTLQASTIVSAVLVTPCSILESLGYWFSDNNVWHKMMEIEYEVNTR